LASYSHGDAVVAHALRATDWLRSLIASATAAHPEVRPLRREEHQLAHVERLAVSGPVRSTNVDGGHRRRPDQRCNDDGGRVQRCGCRELRCRTERQSRQPRRARLVRVEMKHARDLARRVPIAENFRLSRQI
jgi:hypothetical protein